MIAIYCRTSPNSRDEEEKTIGQQKDEGIKFATKQGDGYEVYADEDLTGFSDDINKRPDLIRMLADIKRGKIASVWVWKMSRLARNMEASQAIYSVIRKARIRLFEGDKEYALDNPKDKAFADIMAVFSELDRSIIIENTQRGVRTAREKGVKIGTVPYGYRKIGVKEDGRKKNAIYSIEPKEAAKIRLIFDTVIFKGSISATIRELEQTNDSIKMYNLQTWYKRILTRIEYTGKTIKPSDGTLTPCLNFPVEIVPLDTFNDANKIVFSNINRMKNREDSKLLTGIIRCSVCGNKYYHAKHSGKSTYHHLYNKENPCKGNPCYLNINLEQVVSFTLIMTDHSLDVVKEHFAKQSDYKESKKRELEIINKGLERDLEQVERKIANLINLIEDDPDADFKKRLKDRQEERENIKRSIQANKVAVLGDTIVDEGSAALVSEMINKYHNATVEQQKLILANHASIEVTDGKVFVSYSWGMDWIITLPPRKKYTYSVDCNFSSNRYLITPESEGSISVKIITPFGEDYDEGLSASMSLSTSPEDS